MAVTAGLFGQLFVGVFSGTFNLDWDTDTLKAALTTVTYTPNQDVHDFFNDVTNEVVGTGYTAGGATLGSKTTTYTAGTNTLSLDAADTTWTTSTITARHAVVYKDTGVTTTSPLIGFQSSDVDIVSTGGTFTITWHADGLLKAVLT